MTEDDLPSAETLAAADPQRYPNESAGYRAARTALLAEEIRLRRQIERVAALRRALPPGGEVVDIYRFEGADGTARFADLFGGRDTLVTYSWMFGPERERPCPMCTTLLDAWDGEAKALRERVALAIIARSPFARMAAYAEERGWRRLPLFSDTDGRFSQDYHALPPGGRGEDEMPAFNVFTRRDGVIRHFYGAEMTGATADPGQDPRGAPDFMPLWTILDMTPGGRGADWYPRLDMH